MTDEDLLSSLTNILGLSLATAVGQPGPGMGQPTWQQPGAVPPGYQPPQEGAGPSAGAQAPTEPTAGAAQPVSPRTGVVAEVIAPPAAEEGAEEEGAAEGEGAAAAEEGAAGEGAAAEGKEEPTPSLPLPAPYFPGKLPPGTGLSNGLLTQYLMVSPFGTGLVVMVPVEPGKVNEEQIRANMKRLGARFSKLVPPLKGYVFKVGDVVGAMIQSVTQPNTWFAYEMSVVPPMLPPLPLPKLPFGAGAGAQGFQLPAFTPTFDLSLVDLELGPSLLGSILPGFPGLG